MDETNVYCNVFEIEDKNCNLVFCTHESENHYDDFDDGYYIEEHEIIE